MVEEGEPVFSLITSRLGHSRTVVDWMVKMRRVIRALERPAECREGGGGREEGGWIG
jgi:hypothetical protein